MRYYTYLLLGAILCLGAIAFTNKKASPTIYSATSSKGIHFIEGEWKKALAKAKLEKKAIFVDAYATWCGPCKRMQQDVFPNPAVAEFFNKNFINITLDVEKGEGIAFAQAYGVEVLPTLFITDYNGKPITYAKGYIPADQLLKFGEFGKSKAPIH